MGFKVTFRDENEARSSAVLLWSEGDFGVLNEIILQAKGHIPTLFGVYEDFTVCFS